MRVGHWVWLIGPKLFDPKLTRLAHLLSCASLLYKREIAQGGKTFLDLVRSNILQKFLISRRKDTVAKKRGGKNDKWNYHKTIIGTRITMKKFRVRNNIWKCVSDYNITLSCTNWPSLIHIIQTLFITKWWWHLAFRPLTVDFMRKSIGVSLEPFINLSQPLSTFFHSQLFFNSPEYFSVFLIFPTSNCPWFYFRFSKACWTFLNLNSMR